MRRLNKETLFSVLAYLSVGAASIGLAVYVSSHFLTPSVSQEPPEAGLESSDSSQSSEDSSGEASGSSASTPNIAGIQNVIEPYIYDPQGRRDPFKPFLYLESQESDVGAFQGPLLPLQRFDLDEINLIGIIWQVGDPRAMFRDPNDQVHVLGKDERIGRNNGYIAVIREGEVVVVETVRNKGNIEYLPRVMKLSR